MGVGPIAFSLRFLGPLWAAVLAAGALGFNLFLLPRIGGRKLWREHEHSCRLLARHHPLSARRAAADPGLLPAPGGGGRGLGDPRLRRRHGLGRRHVARPAQAPLEPAEELDGHRSPTSSSAPSPPPCCWSGRRRPGAATLGASPSPPAFATALLAAALESLPQGLDDNLGVPLVSGLFLLGLVLTQGHWGAFLADPGLPLRLAARRR